MNKKKLILITITIITLLSLFSFAWGETGDGQSEIKLASWTSSVINWTIRSVGLISFLVLIYGGFGYLVAGGSTTAMRTARTKIISGIGGMIIVLTSYLVLQTINPQILGGIPKVSQNPDNPITQNPPPEDPSQPFQYQEIPFGSLLETRVLAKNISCFNENHQLVDCHSQSSISQEEKETVAKKMSEEFPEQWPNAQPKDAEIAYQCYAFDKDGEFIDADPSQPGIQPMIHHDRLDCLEILNKAIQAKSKFLRDKTKELAQLSDQCACGYCSCGGCPCPPAGSCNCGGLCAGDPCPGRGRMKQIREQLFREGGCGLFMNQIIQGHNTLRDAELVKVDVDHYQDLTVVNQIRYLSYHFLPPYIASLKTDVSYLKKAENIYKNHCPYGAVISHSSLFDLKNNGEKSLQTKFCMNSQDAQWGEECPGEQQLDITKYCREFNCRDCSQNGQKLPLGTCDLDKLEQGKPIYFQWNNEQLTSYQCSKYLVNNENGEDKVEPTDEMGVVCKIVPLSSSSPEQGNMDRQGYYYDQGALTLYCPNANTRKAEQLLSRIFLGEGVIDPKIEEGFKVGTIALGEMTDNAEAYIKQLTGELKIIVDTSTPEVVCPSYDKNNPNNQCKLFHLPPRCLCSVGVITTQGNSGCGPGCFTTHGCRCNDCGGCPGCPCSTCNAPSLEMDPCPLSVIFKRRDETEYWFEQEDRSVKPKTDHVINLIEAENLKATDYDRRELIAQLTDATLKFEKCIPGFGAITKGQMSALELRSCLMVLDLMNLQKVSISPEFSGCYPYNSPLLTTVGQNACAENLDSVECRNAVKDMMQNFFCIEENKSVQ